MSVVGEIHKMMFLVLVPFSLLDCFRVLCARSSLFCYREAFCSLHFPYVDNSLLILFMLFSTGLMPQNSKHVYSARFWPKQTLVRCSCLSPISITMLLREMLDLSTVFRVFLYVCNWSTDATDVPHAGLHCKFIVCIPPTSLVIHFTSRTRLLRWGLVLFCFYFSLLFRSAYLCCYIPFRLHVRHSWNVLFSSGIDSCAPRVAQAEVCRKWDSTTRLLTTYWNTYRRP